MKKYQTIIYEKNYKLHADETTLKVINDNGKDSTQ